MSTRLHLRHCQQCAGEFTVRWSLAPQKYCGIPCARKARPVSAIPAAPVPNDEQLVALFGVGLDEGPWQQRWART